MSEPFSLIAAKQPSITLKKLNTPTTMRPIEGDWNTSEGMVVVAGELSQLQPTDSASLVLAHCSMQ